MDKSDMNFELITNTLRLILCIVIILWLSIIMSGCSIQKKDNEESQNLMIREGSINWKDVADSYKNVYLKSEESHVLGSIDTTQALVSAIGAAGYCVIDTNNSVNMENREQAETFIHKIQNKVADHMTLISLRSQGGFVQFDLDYKDDILHVVQHSIVWEAGEAIEQECTEFDACSWSYSQEGYFFFEQYHPMGYDGISGHHGVRVQPMDKKCRSLTMLYMKQLGYDMNNLFTINWSEDNFDEINFDDLFEQMYAMTYGKQAPVSFGFTGQIYKIPKKEYETIYQSFFNISTKKLEQKMEYHPQTDSYDYRPRGMYDFTPFAYMPFPEVVGYEECNDGTIRLKVNAVSIDDNSSKVFSHEVVVRPMPDGGFQYVSNKIIEKQWEQKPEWYRERLTKEQWHEYYGE